MTSSSRWPRTDAESFVEGRATFIDDLRPEGLAHLAVVRSTRPHARITGIDAVAAKAVDGVLRVVDGREARLHLRPMPYQFGEPELIGGRRSSLEALPVERVRYVGEPVAVVVAETARAARRGAAAVTVGYDDLPALLDAGPFLGRDPLAPELERHVIASHHVTAGDAAAALARAEHRLDLTFSVARSTTAPIEPRGYLASWDRAGRLTVQASHQQPFQLRAELAEILGLAEADVRVVVPHVGGAFGAKMTGQVEEPLVCLASRLCGRPVKWIESREECFLGGGREQVHRLQVGFDATGRVHALRDDMVVPVGAESVSPGWRQGWVSAASFPTAYDVAHVDVHSRVVATHVPPWHSCRGFGKEAPIFVMERTMDLVGRRLGLDPAEVRRRNLVRPAQLPYRTPAGFLIDSADLPALLDRVAGADDDGARDDAGTGRFVGTGIAVEVTPEGGGHAAARSGPGVPTTSAAPESAAVALTADGRFEVRTGTTSPGSGNETALARLAADELGTTRDAVTVVQGDTDRCPPGTGNASSRAIAVGGPAVVLAARGLATAVRAAAAELLGADTDELVLGAGAVAGPEGQQITLAELHRRTGGVPACTRSYRPEPPEDPGYRYSYPYFSSAAYRARVTVDAGTGAVRLDALTAVHDCGRVVDPVLVEGQLHGALAMGAGLALSEASRTDDAGAPATRSFKEYLVPRANDLPEFVLGHHETPAPYTLLGAKGAGEAGVGGALAAIANAVDDAVGRLGGSPVTTVPLDPPTVLALLHPDGDVR
ncbi:xanthine dehydrogenase family protein molybdopterin-binding subunit [Pseudonocardia nematodicida]|uniref:Xanthine dehydrogenase family protein molybdopterin-binding subunit n=1 Tax=Pseudonocardia nematodicida TaxID=1206997 RepID=A0ABV1KKB3_9PSEU